MAACAGSRKVRKCFLDAFRAVTFLPSDLLQVFPPETLNPISYTLPPKPYLLNPKS